MNKKGAIFMPMFVIAVIIIMATFTVIIYNHKDKAEEYFSVGKLQSNIIKNYFESEKEFFYYEKLLEYNEYKTTKEFGEDGAVPKDCNKKWKFNTDCEPDFKEYFKEILNKKIENKGITIDSYVEVYFTDFNLPTETETSKVDYGGEIRVKKEPLVDFKELEELKLDIKSCIQNKNMNNCNLESSSGTIYTFKRKIVDILNENFESEEVFLEFKIDTSSSGMTTSIF